MRAESDIAAYLDGALAQDRRDALFEHVTDCTTCMQALLECMPGAGASTRAALDEPGASIPATDRAATQRGQHREPVAYRSPRVPPENGWH